MCIDFLCFVYLLFQFQKSSLHSSLYSDLLYKHVAPVEIFVEYPLWDHACVPGVTQLGFYVLTKHCFCHIYGECYRLNVQLLHISLQTFFVSMLAVFEILLIVSPLDLKISPGQLKPSDLTTDVQCGSGPSSDVMTKI